MEDGEDFTKMPLVMKRLLFLMLILSSAICYAQLPAPSQMDTLVITSMRYNYDDIDRENWPYHVIYKSTTYFEFGEAKFEIDGIDKFGDGLHFTLIDPTDEKKYFKDIYPLVYQETKDEITIVFSGYEFICQKYNHTIGETKTDTMTENCRFNENTNDDTDSVQDVEMTFNFAEVEIKPSFHGGDANEFSKWVNERLEYPEIAKENGVQGRVTLQFTIDVDGTLYDVKVLRGVDAALDKEAVRVVSKSPRWKPGIQRGRPVKVTYTFPVVFQLR